MSKLLQERWQRLAFGSNLLSEATEDPRLAPLIDMYKIGGFYFAGADTVILGNLDAMSGKEYTADYPYDPYMGEGAFHIQVSVEKDGTYRIHDYSQVDDKFCSGSMPEKGVKYDTVEEVISIVREMVQCYEEFMDAYEIIDKEDAVVDEFHRYIDVKHPVAQRLMKK